MPGPRASMKLGDANMFPLDLPLILPQDITIRLTRWKMVFLSTVQRKTVISGTFSSMLNSVHPSIGYKIKYINGQRF